MRGPGPYRGDRESVSSPESPDTGAGAGGSQLRIVRIVNTSHLASHHHQPETELLECIFVSIFFCCKSVSFFSSYRAISEDAQRLIDGSSSPLEVIFFSFTLSAKMGANIMGPRALESSNSTFQ